MHSPNLTQDNVTRIRELFPNCVTEALGEDGQIKLAVDFDQLRQELADSIVEGPPERYHLNWPGKREALLTANAPIAMTLRPSRDESVDFDTTQNLFIEGDNLDALRLLQETYLGKIKMIYIDPPYNTGSDLIYRDDYKEDVKVFLIKSDQISDEGSRLTANPETNGRFHSDWLSMIYPRIKLARNLLSDDGVIFVSIDNHEQANVRRLLDEVFGEQNFIENYIWESTFRPDNSSKVFRENAQHVVAFAKNIRAIAQLVGSKEGSTGLPSLTKNSMKESELEFLANEVETALADGVYKAGRFDSGYELLNDVTVQGGKIITPFSLRGRVIWGQSYLREQIALGTKIIIKSEGFVPYSKKPQDAILAPNTIIPSDRVGDVLAGRAEVTGLFGKAVFSYPKPTTLISYLISFFPTKDFIVLDFFAGSGTTAHATLKANLEDGGTRRHITIQFPELCEESTEAYKAGFHNIADLCKARIRLSGSKILKEVARTEWFGDVGFRVLKVDTSNLADVYYAPDVLDKNSLELFVNNIKPDRTPEDLLFQVMLDWGVDLALPITKQAIQGKDVLFVDGNALAAYFDDAGSVDEAFVKELARHQPLRVVFRDAGFKDSAVKINVEQIFKLLSPATEVKSI